jgi:hypothetical protein
MPGEKKQGVAYGLFLPAWLSATEWPLRPMYSRYA